MLFIHEIKEKKKKEKRKRENELKLLPSTSRSGIDYFSRAQLTG